MNHQHDLTTTAVTKSPKTRWPVEAKAFAVKAKRGGKTAVEALAMAANKFGLDLKSSYRKTAGVHSHLARFRRELKQAITNPVHRNHSKAVKASTALGIVQEEAADN